MIIKNANVFTSDHRFVQGDVTVTGDRFSVVLEKADGDGQVVDAAGLYMIPGLVDIHFHGCKGADMCDGTQEALDIITAYEAGVGVTSVCPATMTIPKDELLAVMKNAGAYSYKGGAHLVGVNMEGPFISASKKGAQAAENIIPCDYEYFRQLQDAANGLIRLVDIAPEEPGAMEFIDRTKSEVVISIAHTVSDYDTACEAIRHGASHATHLYNAMPPLNHRNPGVIGAVRDSQSCHVELICDGVHVHPSVIRATFAMFGAERVILISDSMRATGLKDGEYTLGGQPVVVKGNLATLHDGTIAGSATNLMDCMRFVVKNAGIPLEDAMVFDTLHAITMTTAAGTELLIHIGLETVTLKGEPFHVHVAAGDQVKQGDLLMEADLDQIREAGLNIISPVVVCNTDDYSQISLLKVGGVSPDEAVLKVE